MARHLFSFKDLYSAAQGIGHAGTSQYPVDFGGTYWNDREFAGMSAVEIEEVVSEILIAI